MFSFICVLLAVITSCLANSTPPTLKQVCVRDGKTYQIGQSFQPTPCEHCFCSADGRVVCAIADCFFTPCVDAVHDPTKCCPQCPNGENCQHSDGTIIKKGEVYNPDPNTSCMCPSSFHFGPTQAVCAIKAVDPVLHVPVDPSHV
ncbi:von Willebrand factor C domain-containing protein 2-like [Ruditapes philippinarum]|uniref:von Willebrand factor C domain-containing protein 2-like n=1 Tax=Ruditapes philippinarum TaxID=129788 RepID=UPI00295A73AB|nr:von Willebrand factor C domain-containing protein 2-like [Ruditapes philippinarum]